MDRENREMTLRLSLATWDHDRALPLHDGTVSIPGIVLESHIATTGDLFPLAVGAAPYDISELSFASYLIQVSKGESAYIALPVYLSRAFRHGAIYVRNDRGIDTPKDLNGKTVGIPEYAMTLAVWVRGLLTDEYGVNLASMRYRTAGLNEPGRVERLSLDLPSEIDLQPLGAGRTLNACLLSGELDAVIAPNQPRSFLDGHPEIRRLIEPAMPVEQAYFEKTGIFPIMHIVGVRKTLADEHPDLCRHLYHGFIDARTIAMQRVKDVAEGSSTRIMSPWFADAYETARSTMGADYWPYGIDKNRTALETMCRYMHQQHLTSRHLPLEDFLVDV